MSVSSSEARAARDPTFLRAISLLAVLTTCAVVLVVRPRPVLPLHLPPLVLDEGLVERALEEDKALAGRAQNTAQSDEMYALFLAEGRAEREGPQGVKGTAQRRARMAVLARTYLDKQPKDVVVALRARATERFMDALMGKLPDAAESDGLVGTFPNVLHRYGLVANDRTVRAPELAVRAMYKARWNMIHELPPRLYLTSADLQAYEGWNALHAPALAPERRAESARLFYEAGGLHGAEAYGIWLFVGGRVTEALKLFEKAFARQHALRVRNELIATQAAASAP